MNKLKQGYSITSELYNQMLDWKKKILFTKTIISLLTVVHLLV